MPRRDWTTVAFAALLTMVSVGLPVRAPVAAQATPATAPSATPPTAPPVAPATPATPGTTPPDALSEEGVATDDALLLEQVRGILSALPTGTRVGMVVADTDGREILAIDPDGRYVPASNTKIVTTLLAFHRMGDLSQPDSAGATGVRLSTEAGGDAGPDVVLIGRGDARLSAAEDCKVDCLATLADAVAAQTKRVRSVRGDATAFADERWSPGMSWNNMTADYGAAVGALVVDRNTVTTTVTPPARPGGTVGVTPSGFLTIATTLRAVEDTKNDIVVARVPGSLNLVLSGTVQAGGKPIPLALATDNPAQHAVWRFGQMLRARGVTIAYPGAAWTASPDAVARMPVTGPATGDLAQAVPPPLLDTIRVINKDSDNLYAEVLLRRVAALDGPATLARATAAQAAMLTTAGVPRHAFDFSDGSGMSTYNRISPRGMVRLLTWAGRQPWFAAWRDTLPVGGVDGTLKNRFVGTSLQRVILAKTGTLNAANALAGYLVTARGQALVFAVYAGDMPEDQSATQVIDRALIAVADAR